MDWLYQFLIACPTKHFFLPGLDLIDINFWRLGSRLKIYICLILQ